MSEFKFSMKQPVQLIESEEKGTIIGRAQYAYDENSYYVRYKDATGCQRQVWFHESAIVAG